LLPAAREQREATTQRLIGGLLLVAIAAVIAIMTVSSVAVDSRIRWGAVALAVFCAGLLLLLSASVDQDGLGIATWRIGPWTLAAAVPAFGLATVSWIGTVSGGSAEILPDSILRAQWMIAVAMALFALGYCVGPYRLAAIRSRRLTESLSRRFSDEIRGPGVPWLLLGIGLVAQLGFAVLTGRFGYVGTVAGAVTTASGYSQYLAVAGECVQLAVAAAAIRAYRTRTPGAWLSLVIVFAAAISVGALAGGKGAFVIAVLAVIIPYSIIRHRLPVGAIAAALLFFLLIVIPFNQAYRANARGTATLTATEAMADAPPIASHVLAYDASTAMIGQSASFLAQRIREIDSPAIIMQRTPSEIPFSDPAQLLTAPVLGLIPRILWSGKPVSATGYEMSYEYFRLPPQVYTSTAVTPEGDLYRHGGWFPLILGMFLIGCGVRVLDETADLRRGMHGVILILLLFPDIVTEESDCSGLLAGIPGMILLWLGVVTISFARRRRAPALLSPGG
jgi:hypothetical protein